MLPAFDYGAEVRVVRNLRNDGTYPGAEVGELLVRRGSVGHVQDVGTYLQEHVIYRVHFLQEGRVVGCREEELIDASLPWVRNRYEFRDSVVSLKRLSVNGEVVVEMGDLGSVARVERSENNTSVAYQVRFPRHQRELLVPEFCLGAPDDDASDSASHG